MVGLERDADAKVPTKVINTDIDAMIYLWPLTFYYSYSIIVNGIYIID
jgi:hypothetical protein